ESRHHPLADLRARHPQLLQRERDVLEDGHVRPDRVALEDHPHAAPLRRHEQPGLRRRQRPATHLDLASIRTLEPGDQTQRGGLAAAARPEQSQELPGFGFEAQVVHRDHAAERLDEAYRANGAHRYWTVIQPSADGHGKPKILWRRQKGRLDCAGMDWKKLAWVLVPALVMVLIVFAVLTRLVEPLPPRRITISTGRENGAYYMFAKEYAKLARADGFTVDIITGAGSVETLKRLAAGQVMAGFAHGGTREAAPAHGLLSLLGAPLQPVCRVPQS